MTEWIAVIGKVEYRWQYDREKQRLVRKMAIHPIGVPDDQTADSGKVQKEASALSAGLDAPLESEKREPGSRTRPGTA